MVYVRVVFPALSIPTTKRLNADSLEGPLLCLHPIETHTNTGETSGGCH